MSILLRHAAASTTAPPANYIEDVFSTYLYTGTGATQTITNNIDLSTKGGLVWIKNRDNTGGTWTASHNLYDTVRGMTFTDAQRLITDTTDAQVSQSNYIRADTTGFSFGTNATGAMVNASSNTYASWTFREQPKFFDVVTYTGNGANRTIAHNLGSVPGCIIVKDTSAAANWYVYHRSLATNEALKLNSTAAIETSTTFWNNTAATSTNFSLGTAGDTNGSGGTFVAYLFAHDAGGFGLTGTDNVISCGSVTGTGNPTEITLGYEPQWLLIKNADSAQDWWLLDNMRGIIVENASDSKRLNANNAAAETGLNVRPTATGFINGVMTVGQNYVYIAIRRGPMKVPTLGTNVFAAVSRTGTDANAVVTAGFPPDFLITKNRFGTASPIGSGVLDRMRPLNAFFTTSDYAAEDTVQTDELRSWNMTGVTLGPDANTSTFNWSANTYINYMFRRAAGYFDEACYTGTGSNTTQAHNLTTVPELIFVKRRNDSGFWQVYSSALANTEYLVLDSTAAKATGATRWNSTTPTSSVFSLGTAADVNTSAATYIAYLFASAPGVSKVGSYTGNGTTQTIACGFAAGARFILIKRTDSTGDWFVWDTSRGIVAGNDPYLLLNSGAAEVTTNDSIDPDASGFIVNQIAATDINVTSASYIFLAIA